MTLDPQPFIALMARLCCVGILIQTLEVLWNWRELRDDRLLGWGVRPPGGAVARRWLGGLHTYPTCAWLLIVRALLAASGIALDYGGHAAFVWSGAMVAIQLYYNRRFTIIAGNCETLFLICLVAALAGTLPGASFSLKAAALGFVGLHVAIAYAVAGTDKLRSRPWRNGSRLLQVMRDSSYRLPGFAKRLGNGPRLTQILAWSALGFELLFPVAIFLPTQVLALFLIGGICFHAMIAITMGLHGFLWSFTASYPAVWFAHLWVQRGFASI